MSVIGSGLDVRGRRALPRRGVIAANGVLGVIGSGGV